MKYVIDAKLFNAVNACAAVDDSRYFLQTFFVDAESNQIVGTNGHIMAIAPIVPDNAGQAPDAPINGKTHGWLFNAIKKPLSKSVDTVTINTDSSASRLELRGYRYRGDPLMVLAPCDGTYPDYQQVMADNGRGSAIPTIGLDSFYLARVAKWAHQETGRCVLTFKNERDAIEVRYPELTDLHITLMPCRI